MFGFNRPLAWRPSAADRERHFPGPRSGQERGARLRLRRTVLFFPASAPDRYAKAVASGADTGCIDLEDAVPPDDKDEARKTAVRSTEAAGTGHPQGLLRSTSPKAKDGRP